MFFLVKPSYKNNRLHFKLIKFLLIGWLVLVATTMQAAQAQALNLPDKQTHSSKTHIFYDNALQYWVDASNQADFRTAQSAPYVPLNHRSLGYSTHPHWFKIEVQSHADSPQSWLLSTYWPVLDYLDIWVQQSTSLQHYALGDHRPLADNLIKSRYPTIPVTLAPHESATIYLRVQTTSLVMLTGEFWQADAFLVHDKTDDILYGAYFGLFIMVSLIFALFGGWLKDRAMLAYSAYVFSFMLAVLAINGYVNVLFPAGSIWLSDFVMGCTTPLVGIASAAMWLYLLNTKKAYPWLHSIYKGIIIIFALAIPFITTTIYPYIILASRIFWILQIFVPMYLNWVIWRKNRQTEYLIYFLSFLLLTATGANYLLMISGVIKINYFIGMHYQNALLTNVFIMSIGMVYRIKKIQDDKAEAENAATVAKQHSQEVRRFVAMLSHEFRNPIAAIDRSAQMLQLAQKNIEQQVLKRIEGIRANTKRLSSLVDNFLISERLETQQLTLELQNFSTMDLVQDIQAQISEAEWARIQLEHKATFAYFDLALLSMAVGNLIHNALRYANPQGVVTLSIHSQGQILHIQVADEGPSISAEEIAMLGKPYFRATSAVGKKGTGLGYYFTRRIVELHQGTITASQNQVSGLTVDIQINQTQALNTTPLKRKENNE